MKVVYDKKGNKNLIKDVTKDYHNKLGAISKDDFDKRNVKTNKGDEVTILDADFIDLYERIKRTAQIMTLKDIGTIITYCGLGKDSLVIDSGSGSGGACCFIAHIVKKVYTYDNNKEHIKSVLKNIEDLGIKNIELIERDVYLDGYTQKNVDLVILDIKEPWFCLKHAANALKRGGFLVSYSPNITQTSELIAENERSDKENYFIHLKTIEIIEREWIVEGIKARPSFAKLGHTGFLTFMRKT